MGIILGPFTLFHVRPDKVASLFLFNCILNFHVGGWSLFITEELPVTQPGAFHTGWKKFHLGGVTSCRSTVAENTQKQLWDPHDTLHDVEIHVNKRVCHTGRILMKVEAAVLQYK